MKIKFHKKILIYYLFVVVFMPPQCLYSINGTGNITKLLAAVRYVSSILTILYAAVNNRAKKDVLKPYVLCSFSAIILQILALYMNKTIYLTAALSCVTFIGFLEINILCWNRNKGKLLLAYKNIIYTYAFIHFVTLLVCSNGLVDGYSGDGRVFFMGTKNTVTSYIILALLAEYLYWTIKGDKRKRLRKVAKSIVMLNLFVLLNGSATAMAIVGIIDIYFIMEIVFSGSLKFRKQVEQLFLIVLAITIVVFFGGIVLQSGGDNPIVGAITAVFGKDITFNGRTAIWEAAIVNIAEHPLWGMGLGVKYDVWGNYRFVYSAHNTILEYGVKYGCISLAFFLFSLFMAVRILVKKWGSEEIRFCLLIMLSIILSSMFEAMDGYYAFWSILFIPYLFSNVEHFAASERI